MVSADPLADRGLSLFDSRVVYGSSLPLAANDAASRCTQVNAYQQQVGLRVFGARSSSLFSNAAPWPTGRELTAATTLVVIPGR